MATSGALDARLLLKLDASITGSNPSGRGLGALLGDSKAGRLLGGVVGGASSNGVGVRVSGTASAPQFKVDPAAAVDLLKAGLGSGQPSSKPGTPRQSSRKDALNDLLRGVLH